MPVPGQSQTTAGRAGAAHVRHLHHRRMRLRDRHRSKSVRNRAVGTGLYEGAGRRRFCLERSEQSRLCLAATQAPQGSVPIMNTQPLVEGL